MNPETMKALQDWLRGRDYTLEQAGASLILRYRGQERAVITPPDRYQVKNVDMNFNEWVEFNKCIRNIRHYLNAQS